jgi:uncharacterized protein
MPFRSAVTTVGGLRAIYPMPSTPSVSKEIGYLDEHCRTFIAHSTFMVMATGDSAGACDVSPKGGPPGFVHVLDEHRLAIPDLSGNNRLDSLVNLVERPGIALLFCVPGLDETLRVNGVATITTDPEVLDAAETRGIRPRVVIGVDVDIAFLHCAKALRRGAVWRPEEWPDTTGMPSVACMLRDHYGIPGLDVEAVQERLDNSYGNRMWLPGGEPTT